MVCAGHLRAVSPPLPPSLAAGGIPKGMNSPATVSGFDHHAHAVPPFMRRRLRGRGLPPGDERGRRMRVGGTETGLQVCGFSKHHPKVFGLQRGKAGRSKGRVRKRGPGGVAQTEIAGE